MNLRSHAFQSPASFERPIYLDHHATTPVDPRVAARMFAVMADDFGNPNDRGHFFGEQAGNAIEDARVAVAALVSSAPQHVAFVRSATVAFNVLIDHLVARYSRGRRLRAAATTVEHHAVLDALGRKSQLGEIDLRLLEVDCSGRLDLDLVAGCLNDGCDVLFVMAANNEVGTIYPIQKIAELARDREAALVVDASQAAASLRFNVDGWGPSYLILSSHKMYGPKGVAALISNGDRHLPIAEIEALEGTPNVPAIAGFGEACTICATDMDSDTARIRSLRDRLQSRLTGAISGLHVNGDVSARLPNNLHVSVPGVPNDAVLARLFRSVAISTGSACRAGVDEPSHVLRAMNLESELIDGALRIGLGRGTTADDVDQAGQLITEAINSIRALEAVEG